MIFWLSAALLCLLAALFLLRALRDDGASDELDPALLYRDRLRELERERELGVIAPETFESMCRELERRYLSEGVATVATRRGGDGARFGWLCAVLVVVLAAGLYSLIGGLPDWRIQSLLDEIATEVEAGAEVGSAQQVVIGQLERRLEADPERQRHRYALAQVEMGRGNLEAALRHYRVLAGQRPRDADVLAQAAQLAYLVNERTVTPEVRGWAQRALELEPDQATALGVAGIDAFEQGDYAGARDLWRRLLAQLPEGSPGARVIAQGLREAETRLLAEDPSAPRIEVAVSLGNGLPAEGVLFVFARSADARGDTPPLAVARVGEPRFPLMITLDDSTAMTENARLSSAEEVVVIARLSPSGEVRGGAADLQAASDAIPVRPGTQRVQLELHRPEG